MQLFSVDLSATNVSRLAGCIPTDTDASFFLLHLANALFSLGNNCTAQLTPWRRCRKAGAISPNVIMVDAHASAMRVPAARPTASGFRHFDVDISFLLAPSKRSFLLKFQRTKRVVVDCRGQRHAVVAIKWRPS